MMSPGRARGLTLVEVLVAMAILALLALLAYRALDSTLRVRERVAAESDRWRELAFLFDRLRDDVDQPAPRGPRMASGARVPAWSGTATSLDLAKVGAGATPLSHVQYRLRDGAVELLLWPVFDAAATTEPEVHTLVRGVGALRLRYLDASRVWRDAWPGTGAEPPRAVRLELTLADGAVVSRLFALPR